MYKKEEEGRITNAPAVLLFKNPKGGEEGGREGERT
jgi:hypothetical protein